MKLFLVWNEKFQGDISEQATKLSYIITLSILFLILTPLELHWFLVLNMYYIFLQPKALSMCWTSIPMFLKIEIIKSVAQHIRKV